MSDLMRTQILLNRAQHEYLSAVAQREGRSLSEVIRSALDVQIRQWKYQDMQKAAEQLKVEYEARGDLSAATGLDGGGLSDG